MKRQAATTIALLISATAVAEEAKPTTTENDNAWLDSTHGFVVHHADNIAEWFDGFFGDSRMEEEAPYSTVRLRLEGSWDEDNDFEDDISLRGKIRLPALNKRLSLLFQDDEDDSRDDLNVDEQDSPDDVALQFTAAEKKHYRIDTKLGLTSSGNPKGSVRYRHRHPVTDELIRRFSVEAGYKGGEGASSRTRLEFDKIMDEKRVLSWNNKVDWEEEEHGVDWNSSLALNQRLSDKQAIAYYISVNGQTQPEPEAVDNSFGVGFRYRQNVLRPWLYYEIQPYYRWNKYEDHSDRDGVAGVKLRLEAVFERAAD